MKHPVIDVHTHPAFVEEVCASDEQLDLCRRVFGLYRTDRRSLQGMAREHACAGIDRIVLLPLDVTSAYGRPLPSNDDVRRLVDFDPDRFVGFAGVDPHREDALDELERAFRDLDLRGLKLHPARQRFYPDDPALQGVYELCVKYDRPVTFHAGMSVQPGTLAQWGHPLRFEEVALGFPDLRICLGHFGWPWVRETAMLLLKYPNVYADTALLYFDTPREFYAQTFTRDMGPHWLDRSLRHQVMFGSDDPRLEQIRMIEAVRALDVRVSTRDLLLGGNAVTFLGG